MCDVTAAVRALPDKQSSSDTISTRLLKDHVDILAPYLVELFNCCLVTGSVPSAFKSAYIEVVEAVEKVKPRLGRPKVLSTDRQSVGSVKAARASRR